MSDFSSFDLKKEEQLTLASVDIYVQAGLPLGTKFKSKYMRNFIYKTKPEGINIIDIRSIDERIRIAAKFMSYYEPERILVVASRPYAIKPANLFAQVIGAVAITGRFLPGTLTNPSLEEHKNAELLFINDPLHDSQAVNEASKLGIPVVALCDTEHKCEDVDFVIPCNNKGRRALATVYWLLARQILREKGLITSPDQFKYTIEDFEAELVEETE
ncbi:MAG: 30S ribosomal protein S2 [Thermoproteota archaeon]|jgi:SSU ribosomal protein S2P